MLQKTLTVALVLVSAVGCGGPGPAPAPASVDASGHLHSEVPSTIDPSAHYLFYLHGRIIEEQGVRPTHPVFGVYEYEAILETFAGRGFEVISEARPAGTEAATYAGRVAAQVRTLVDAGVPPEHVTVIGFSKGGGIAILASSLLTDDRLNFVFIASCGRWYADRPEVEPRGRLLGLREASDDLAGPCDDLFARAPEGPDRNEIVLDLGGGHGAFYRPHPEWVDPVVAWASAPE
jgi:hypothetical protein